MIGVRSIFCALALAVLVPFAGRAVDASPRGGTGANAPLNDNIDRTAPDFVKASLLVMGPGKELYSCAGHACFRLECPKFNLDYCFSYEGESAADQIFRFFAGKLKMGMFAVPTQEFLKQYETGGRGVRQYVLNLSPAAKVRLWKILDDLVAKGADLPYDHIKRGCAQSTLSTLLSAIQPDLMEQPPCPEKFRLTRREILHSYIADYPWTRLMLHMISGPKADRAATMVGKIITPDDMLAYLRGLKANGQVVLMAEPIELLPQTLRNRQSLFTPMVASLLMVLLSVVSCFRMSCAIGAVLLSVYALIGLLESYIVFFSDLPASSWNWILIPFNPLPLVFWRWRRYWALPFVAVIAAWEGYMLFNGHALTDPAFLVLAAAYIVCFLRFVPSCAFLGKVQTLSLVRARSFAAPQKGGVA